MVYKSEPTSSCLLMPLYSGVKTEFVDMVSPSHFSTVIVQLNASWATTANAECTSPCKCSEWDNYSICNKCSKYASKAHILCMHCLSEIFCLHDYCFVCGAWFTQCIFQNILLSRIFPQLTFIYMPSPVMDILKASDTSVGVDDVFFICNLYQWEWWWWGESWSWRAWR